MRLPPPLPPGDPREKDVRSALARLIVHGVDAVWLPEAQPLLGLPAVRKKVAELGEEHTAEALKSVLQAAVDELGESQYRSLLTIVLGLDPRYEDLSAGEKRGIAGKEFRGGTRAVSAGTIRQHHEPRALDQLASLLVSPHLATRLGQESSPQIGPEIVWHPDLHRLRDERLVFWRFSFVNYRRVNALHTLSTAMEKCGIRSWSAYETYGLFDAMVAAWVPELGWGQANSALINVLGSSIELFEYFTVEQLLVDSTWGLELGASTALPKEALASPPTPREIEQLNEGSSDLDLDSYESQGMIRRKPFPAIGIGFFITVSLQGHALVQPQMRRAFENRIADVTREAPSISDLAVYAGSGFANFLIKGTISSRDLSDLNRTLIEPLLAADPVEGMRINTFITSSPSPVFSAEYLPGGEEGADPRRASDLLQQDEGVRFEVKAAAFVDLPRWLAEGDAPPRTRSDGRAAASLLREITAFLNTDGGDIMIGALEGDRFADKFEHPLLTSAPRVGQYLVTGIDHEIQGEIDEFEGRLLSLCRTRIQPDAVSYLQLRFDRVGDRTVCIIEVRPPEAGGSRPWFYCGQGDDDLKFVVRRGAQTIVLLGPEADQYKALRQTK